MGLGTGVSVGLAVGVGIVAGGEAPVGLPNASTVAWTPAATVASMSGGGLGVGEGSAFSTAAWTRAPMSGVGAGDPVGPHATVAARITANSAKAGRHKHNVP